jgi:hypothetical protein
MKDWTGKELAEDLACTLQSEGKMVWVNIPLGSVQLSNAQIADVLCINKSFTTMAVRIYEVKVTRVDFLGDVARYKYAGYFDSAHFVYFAIPQGLLKVNELPQDGVGLIVRTDSTWHVAKAARRTGYNITIELLQKLLMRGYETHCESYRSPKYREDEVKRFTTLRQAFYDYGVKVAKEVAEAQEAKTVSKNLLGEINAIMGKDYTELSGAVCGLREDVRKLMLQYKGVRLALPLAQLAMKLFNGDLYYTYPVRSLEQLLEQAKEEFPHEK